MIKELTHSRFTPSLLTHQALEAIFVRREDLAERLVNSIRESASTGNKHFILLHGPRGIGKTHLISLVHGRIQEDAELSEKLRIAWLHEEEWGVASYVDLLRVVLRALCEKYEDSELAKANESLLGFSVERAELEAEKLLLNFVGSRTLMILTENIDEIFGGLEEKGQKQFRALIQNNPIFTIIATTRGLFEGVEQRESPFYGFFNIMALDEFTAENATELLRKIAQQENDPELAALLVQRQGRSRIRALHYLAGGNPRVYVIFSQFLTRESLDSLVPAVMNTLDNLTSYYQERMARLTPQQRKIVQFLCDQQGAPTVKFISGSNFITHQTASGQLKKLRELGYVRSEQRGRESYYELKEPLMRIALGVKKHRGAPLALLVEFLRLWYTHEELILRLDVITSEMVLERTYITHAIQAQEECLDDPVVAANHRDYMRCMDSEDFELALQIVDDLLEIRNSAADWVKRATCLLGMNKKKDAIESLQQALIVDTNSKLLLYTMAYLFSTLGCQLEAMETYDKCNELDPGDARSWRARGYVLLQLDRIEDALESFNRALELDPSSSRAWNSRGVAFGRIGRHSDALDSFERALDLTPNDLHFRTNYGFALQNLERHEEAIAAFDLVIADTPDTASAWFHKGVALSKLGRREDALASFDNAIRLDPDEPEYWILHGLELMLLERIDKSMASFKEASDLDPNNSIPWIARGAILWDLGRLDEACSALKRRAELSDGDAESWRDLAEAQSVLGQQQDALTAFDRAFQIDANCKDFSGLSHRAVAAMLSGRWDEGRENLDAGLSLLLENRGSDPKDEVGIVRNMLLRTREQSIWRKHLTVWVELFSKHHVLSSLGQGLVRSIQTFQIPWIDQNTKQAWYQIWSDLAGAYKEMALPLRLLKTAVEYHEAKDDRVLFQLPIEERQLLEPLLGIEK